MEQKPHLLSHFIPGILLGAVIGFAFGTTLGGETLMGLKESTIGIKTVQGACDAPGAQVTFVTSDNAKKTTVYLDGKTAFFKIFDEPHQPVIFKQTNKNAYITFEDTAQEAYAPYEGAENLYRVDLCTRDVTELWNNEREESKGYVLDVGPNEMHLAIRQYVKGEANVRLNVYDIGARTGNAFSLPSPMYQTFDAKFSPDSTKIAIVAAIGNEANEKSILYVFDRVSKVFEKRTTEREGQFFTLAGWVNNDVIDYE